MRWRYGASRHACGGCTAQHRQGAVGAVLRQARRVAWLAAGVRYCHLVLSGGLGLGSVCDASHPPTPVHGLQLGISLWKPCAISTARCRLAFHNPLTTSTPSQCRLHMEAAARGRLPRQQAAARGSAGSGGGAGGRPCIGCGRCSGGGRRRHGSSGGKLRRRWRPASSRYISGVTQAAALHRFHVDTCGLTSGFSSEV